MRKSLLSAVALTAIMAFSGSAWADVLMGVGAPITGPMTVPIPPMTTITMSSPEIIQDMLLGEA